MAFSSSGVILIVDDTPNNILVLLHAMEESHKVLVAKSGEEALRKAREHRPDLVLLDIMMPGMDGFEVCRRLKQDDDTRRIPVIFVTAVNDNVNEEKGLKLGAIDYIRKPFHLPVVKARVRNHLRLKRKSDMLEELVRIDGLTDIPNRRGFDETLEREWRRCRREEASLALVLLDVDRFKDFNDRYGHAEGDTCLTAVAAALAGTVRRAGDFVARYGGEEFVALLPHASLDAACDLAESIRLAVAQLAIPHDCPPGPGHVTVSLGVCAMHPTGEDAMVLVRCADNALYQAKRDGRDCVCRYSEADGEQGREPDGSLQRHGIPRS